VTLMPLPKRMNERIDKELPILWKLMMLIVLP
jgi:hypothetical protein